MNRGRHSNMYAEYGMIRKLVYQEVIKNDPQMKAMCMKCKTFCGIEHDYSKCKGCAGFQMYCELEEYRFADTF